MSKTDYSEYSVDGLRHYSSRHVFNLLNNSNRSIHISSLDSKSNQRILHTDNCLRFHSLPIHYSMINACANYYHNINIDLLDLDDISIYYPDFVEANYLSYKNDLFEYYISELWAKMHNVL